MGYSIGEQHDETALPLAMQPSTLSLDFFNWLYQQSGTDICLTLSR